MAGDSYLSGSDVAITLERHPTTAPQWKSKFLISNDLFDIGNWDLDIPMRSIGDTALHRSKGLAVALSTLL